MKIRNGFVSNSSSSSFIVGLDQAYSRDLMREKLFRNNSTVPYEYSWGEDTDWLIVDDLLNWVDVQFQEQNKITNFEQFVGAYHIPFDTGPKWPSHIWELPEDEKKAAWEKYNKECEEFKANSCKHLWKKFKPYAEAGNLYNISFSDNDGRYGSQLEHGTNWTGEFEAIKFSHH